MAEGQESKNASCEMQKEMRETDSQNSSKPATDETNNAIASNNQDSASGKSQNLEDLLRTLHQQITTSDWLEKNTSDQWVEDNPDIAQVFLDAAKKS